MSNKKITAFIVFYIGIVLAILFTFFYVQDRYGHNPPRQKSGLNNEIIDVEKLRTVNFEILTIDGRRPINSEAKLTAKGPLTDDSEAKLTAEGPLPMELNVCPA